MVLSSDVPNTAGGSEDTGLEGTNAATLARVAKALVEVSIFPVETGRGSAACMSANTTLPFN